MLPPPPPSIPQNTDYSYFFLHVALSSLTLNQHAGVTGDSEAVTCDPVIPTIL